MNADEHAGDPATIGASPHTIVDVERLVLDLQDRAQARRTANEYPQDIFDARFEIRPGRIVLRPQITESTKRVVGPLITRVKRILFRLQAQLFSDIVAQANTALDLSRAQTAAEAEHRRALEARVAELDVRLATAEALVPGKVDRPNPSAPRDPSTARADP